MILIADPPCAEKKYDDLAVPFFLSSFQIRQHRLELGPAAVAEQFVDGHLRRRNHRAGAAHALDAGGFVGRASGARSRSPP